MKVSIFSAQESAENRKVFFGFIWGLSIILYEIEEAPGIQNPLSFGLSVVALLAAVFITVRPKNDLAWILLSVSISSQVLSMLPRINNHSVLFAILGVGIAASIIYSKILRRYRSTDWLQENEPFIRLVFLLGYGAAAIAKLNYGFFNYQISCANSIATKVFSWLPFKIPFDSFVWLPYLVSASELFVFFGLLFLRTRPWALVVASLFHFSLSLNYTAAGLAFNPALLSMLVFFLPSSATNDLASVFKKLLLSKIAKICLISLYGLALILVLVFWKIVPLTSSILAPSFFIEVTVDALLFAAIIALAIRSRNEKIDTKFVSVPSPIASMVVVILVLNAAMPYLGGKTGATLSMYSNLRVEGGESNHFFLPRLPIKTQQDDLVKIISSSSPRLENFAKKNILINFATLQQISSFQVNNSVTYERSGTTYQIPVIGNYAELVKIDPFWGKLSFYRDVPVDGTCVW
jgi:hypothetical protein